MKLNKASTADTASLLLQDNFSSRAELGLMGDDVFHVKVSPNGSSWYEALTIAQSSGLVSLPIGQLAFPAAQNPSSDPNTLDDYEEGAWTPVIAFGGASTGVTYGAVTQGRYTKVGRTVFVSCVVTLTSKGSATGAASLTGLPFTAINDNIAGSCSIGYAAAFSSITGALLGLVQPNTSRVALYHSNNGAATALTNSNFQNTSSLYLSGAFDIA